MEYSDEEIQKMVQEVREAILGPVTSLAKSETSLNKEESDPSPSSKENSAPAESSSSAPAGDSGPPSDPGATPPGDAPGSSPEDPGQDPAMGGEMDIAQLQQAYAGLSDEELHMHFEALKGEMFNRMGQGQGDGMPPGDPGMGAPPPDVAPPGGAGAPPPADPNPPAMVPNGSPDTMKSEKELKLEELTKSQEDLQKTVAKMTDLLTEMLVRPQRKTITSMADYTALNKTEGSTKKPDAKEIKAKLAKVVEKHDLSKSDRELITRATLNGVDRGGNSVKFEEIEHLIK